MIVGIGTDIVKISRFQKAMEQHNKKFLEKIFSGHEITSTKEKKNQIIHLAGKFAAKESVLKALGMGLGKGISLKEIEIVNSKMGKPEVRLHGKGLELAKKMAVKNIHITISHEKEFAVAFVLFEGDSLVTAPKD